jgi:hypothetical protein
VGSSGPDAPEIVAGACLILTQLDGLAAVLLGIGAAVVVEVTAAPGLDGPPLQAAMATPTTRVPAVINAAQRSRGRRLGLT